MEDKLLVIKESDLDYILSKARMSGSAKIMFKDRTSPASEVFEAGRFNKDEEITDWVIQKEQHIKVDFKYNTYTDYEKTKI